MKIQDILATVGAGIFFIVLFFLFHWNPIVAAVLAVGIYFALGFLLRPRKKIGNVDLDSIAGGEQIGAALENARSDLKEIQRAGIHSSSATIREGSSELVRTGTNIIRYLEANVDRIPSAQHFLNYYLDTAVEILKKYTELEGSGAPGKEMAELTGQTEQAIGALNTAFENQYSRLLQGEIMDIEGDIDLLKKTVEMENTK